MVLFHRTRDLELEALPGVVSFVAGSSICVPRDTDVAHFETRADGYFGAGVFVFGRGDLFGECGGVALWDSTVDGEGERGHGVRLVAELYGASVAKNESCLLIQFGLVIGAKFRR